MLLRELCQRIVFLAKETAWAQLHVFVKVQWRARLLPLVSMALGWHGPVGLWGLVEVV